MSTFVRSTFVRSTFVRSTTARATLAAVLTVATVTGALAAPRSAQQAREAAAWRDQAAYGAYAAAPAPVFGGGAYIPGAAGLYAPAMPYAPYPYAASDSDRLDPAKGHIQGN